MIFAFRSDQYFLARSVPVTALITSTIDTTTLPSWQTRRIESFCRGLAPALPSGTVAGSTAPSASSSFRHSAKALKASSIDMLSPNFSSISLSLLMRSVPYRSAGLRRRRKGHSYARHHLHIAAILAPRHSSNIALKVFLRNPTANADGSCASGAPTRSRYSGWTVLGQAERSRALWFTARCVWSLPRPIKALSSSVRTAAPLVTFSRTLPWSVGQARI